jgi:SAM-dependent methyltransferase
MQSAGFRRIVPAGERGSNRSLISSPVTSQTADVERWSSLKVWLFSLFNRDPKSNLAAVELLTLMSDDRFLDLGCGLGAALEHADATGAKSVGIDPSPAMVERAARRVPGAEVREGSAESIPFEDDRFTAALAVSTYHHWADPDAGLAEVRRVLAPGGRLLIFERKLKKSSGHGMDRAGADRLARMLATHGYDPAQVTVMRVGRVDFLAVSAANPSRDQQNTL